MNRAKTTAAHAKPRQAATASRCVVLLTEAKNFFNSLGSLLRTVEPTRLCYAKQSNPMHTEAKIHAYRVDTHNPKT